MDRRLLRYYERELLYVKEVAGEWAREHPKIAGRLGIDPDGLEVQDPYVERLIESFAFLTARVQLKLDAQFPRFTQHLLELVYPSYLAPTPAMAIVQFAPDLDEGSLVEGYTVPRGTQLRSMIARGETSACTFETAHAVELWPLELTRADYTSREVARLRLPDAFEPRAAIRLNLSATAGLSVSDLTLDRLTFHLHGPSDIPMRLYERLLAHLSAIIVRPSDAAGAEPCVLPATCLRMVGFDDDQAMLPQTPAAFSGYRLLSEYFAFHRRFMFVELTGLADAVRQCEQPGVEILFLLDLPDDELERGIDAEAFRLFCTPAINLFRKRADMIHLTDRVTEHHVVPDRTQPLSFEVYAVESVVGYGARSEDELEFRPFYAANDLDVDGPRSAYYAVQRRTRLASAREKRVGRVGAQGYPGSEVFLSLVDARNAPVSPDLRTLAVSTWCTNRDLPIFMPLGRGATDFTLDVGGPIESVRCVGSQTPPRPSFAEGETAWRLASHLSLNYLSLTDHDDRQGAEALRELLRLHASFGADEVRKQIEGVRSISCHPIVRQVGAGGPITFARGLELTLVLDESAFEGVGAFLLGAVLDEFFARYVSINSFTQTVVRTVEDREVVRWPARTGRRHIL